jgi:UPF0755 protein
MPMARGTRTPKRREKRAARAGMAHAKRAIPWARVARATTWVCCAVLGLAAVLSLLLMVVYPARRGPGSGREVELAVPGDESVDALAARLEAAGVVASPRLFALYLRVRGGADHVARGAHLLTDDLSPGEIIARLERRGRAARVKTTIPEGFTRFDIGKRLEALRVCTQKAFLDATTRRELLDELHVPGESAEGYLFPATYDFQADSDAAEVVRRMKLEFDKRYAAIAQARASGELDLVQSLGWGMKEVVTLASMIEKEAVANEERPMIASVFLNRLRDPAFKKKVLQCDPTAGYGCLVNPALPACAGYHGRITHEINADPDNAFSTYTHEGLPPGPIASPGARSLEAVLAPATTRYLYFVARGEGHHTFSETYDGHAAAVRESGPRR